MGSLGDALLLLRLLLGRVTWPAPGPAPLRPPSGRGDTDLARLVPQNEQVKVTTDVPKPLTDRTETATLQLGHTRSEASILGRTRTLRPHCRVEADRDSVVLDWWSGADVTVVFKK